ncbi:MAG: DUF1566 domain-containing protein [Candidatus Schekmanbacteria bacterium]|nr:DUF1566 domain-containing protein [Candidatus Schekmanbacteria bacterium]
MPQTGQETCYYSSGKKLFPCYETGQDGDIRAGVTLPQDRFIADKNETITDKLTGLMWVQKGNTPNVTLCNGGAQTWQSSLEYVQCLNNNTYLGYSDWRMPNIREIESLKNLGKPKISKWLNKNGFFKVKSEWYWSSTSYPDNKSSALIFDMQTGEIDSGDKNNDIHYILPVRSVDKSKKFSEPIIQLPQTGQIKCYDSSGLEIPCNKTGQDGNTKTGADLPKHRFVDNGNGSINDKSTGLSWAKELNSSLEESCSGEAQTWSNALGYIECLNNARYLGHKDWRLPNRNELLSLIDYSNNNPALPKDNPFVNIESDYLWSSSTDSSKKSNAWLVRMSDGDVASSDKDNNFHVLPVRAGKPGPALTSDLKVISSKVKYNNHTNIKYDKYEITVTIKNIGDAKSSSFNVGLLMSSYPLTSYQSVRERLAIGYGPIAKKRCEGLKKGETKTITFTSRTYSYTSTYRGVFLDYDFETLETNYNNNLSDPIDIITPRSPDTPLSLPFLHQ